MAYNTGNAIGSTSPKDLSDNARNLDLLMLGPLHSYPDRKNVNRLSWAGIEGSFAAAQVQRLLDFQAQMSSMGYELPALPYAGGLTISRVTQLIEKDGEFYRAKPGVVPFVTTGSWPTDLTKLVSVGDASLRSELFANGGGMVGVVSALTGGIRRAIASEFADHINVKRFGAIGDYNYHPLSEFYPSLAAAQLHYANVPVTSLSQSVDWAATYCALENAEAKGGMGVYFPAGGYVNTDGCLLPDSVRLFCDSMPGHFDVVFPNRPKTWFGANFFAYGTGAKSWSRRGVTSMQLAGGERSGNRLSSLMNSDASGATPATPKSLSWLFRPKYRPSRGWSMTNIRLCPWIGADGKSEYSNPAYTGLAANWDGGLLMEDCENVRLRDFQSVGYWREYALLLLNSDFDVFGAQERNTISDYVLQGRVGLGIRSGDVRAVAALSPSTVEIVWDNESFWPASGQFTGFPASVFQQYNYTSLSRNGANLVFNGVTPNPTLQGLTQLRAPCRGAGAAGTMFMNGFVHGLDHTNGGQSTAYGLGPSTAMEISGYPMRGLEFFNTKIQTREAIRLFIHDCQDTLMIGCQVEGGTGAVIGSPSAANSSAPNPSGDSRGAILVGCIGFSGPLWAPRGVVDFKKMFNVSGLDDGLDVRSPSVGPITISNTSGTETARFTETNRLGIGTANPAQKFQVSDPASELVRFERTGSAGLVGTEYVNTAGKISLRLQPSGTDAGSLFCSGNGTVSNGTVSFPWSDTRTLRVSFGATSTILTSGSGSPEGVVTAGPGSKYSDTVSGNAYRKASGSGNTGWVIE